jgi:AraC family transcriptional regulator, arabinose operon regulatory protein
MNRPITPHTPAGPIHCSEFREGRGYTNWRPRGSGDWLLIQTCGGAGCVTLPTGPRRLLPGDAVLFAPTAMQDYRTDENPGHWHLRWAHFEPRPHWRPWLIWPEIGRGVGLVSTGKSAGSPLQAALSRMLTAHRLGGPESDALAMNALEEVLIWIHRLSAGMILAGVDTRVRQAVQYLASHAGEPFNLGKLAAHCGLSGSRLSHLFQAEMAMSPQRFGEKIRMDLARQLLAQTNLSVAEVAQETGFPDPLYFSRRFRRTFGHPPSHGRRAE